MIADNSATQGAPIIVEQNPIYDNVLGRIERESQLGTLTTDFTLIRGGSVHRANGGFLVMRAEQLLRHNRLRLVETSSKIGRDSHREDLPQRIGYASVRSLAPEPIPLELKVVLIGDSTMYQLLYEYHPEFRELFQSKSGIRLNDGED